MNLPPAPQRGPLRRHLEELAAGVEGLLGTGLAAASGATLETFEVVFREASRRRLLRLGGTLRYAREEIRRYLDDDESFSSRRLAFFLNRSWLLARGLARALDAGDEEAWTALLLTPSPRPAPELEVVTLGVAKKVTEGVTCAFDFHLRVLSVSGPHAGRTAEPSADVREGQSLVWTCLYPVKDAQVPAEAYLQLEQKQGFRPTLLVEKPVRVKGAAVAVDGHGGRLFLGPETTVEVAGKFTDWRRFHDWDPAAVLERLRAHRPGPLDLEVELQEEVVLHDWRLGKREAESFGDSAAYRLAAAGLELTAVAKAGAEGRALAGALEELRGRPGCAPLFGLLHFELCRFVVRPLALLEDGGPRHLMLSKTRIGTRELLRTLDFSN